MLPRRVLFACLWAALTVSTAWAEARLEVTGGDDDLRDEIAGASILLRDEGAPDLPADVIAVARAEYGRLLAVLYDQGYFAGVISIRIDGREAAQISPFAAPAAISDIAIRVEPGARFTLGTA
ncbi:MAG: outer membrane protein assembly factor, partial [Pseudomonadota bacterium]